MDLFEPYSGGFTQETIFKKAIRKESERNKC